MHIFCSICQEQFLPINEVYFITCGHIFHKDCLEKWNKQKQDCPHCRARIRTSPMRIFFSVENETRLDAIDLQCKIDSLAFKIKLKETEVKEANEKLVKSDGIRKELVEHSKVLENEIDKNRQSILLYKQQLRDLRSELDKKSKHLVEFEELKKKIVFLENVEKIVKGNENTVAVVLKNTERSEQSFRQLCTYVEILKQELKKVQLKQEQAVSENRIVNRDLLRYKDLEKQLIEKCDFLSVVNKQLEEKLTKMTLDKSRLENENKGLKRNILESKKRALQPLSTNNEVDHKKQKLSSSELVVETSFTKSEKEKVHSVFKLDLDLEDESQNGSLEVLYDSARWKSPNTSKAKNTEQCDDFKTWMTDLDEKRSLFKKKSSVGVSYPKTSPYYNPDVSIFNKKKATCRSMLSSASIPTGTGTSRSKSFNFDGMGGSSKVPVKPTPREEYLEARLKVLQKKKVGPIKKSNIEGVNKLDRYFSDLS